LMQLRFVTSESAFDYFRTTRAYLEAHGKPVAFYSDKHGIFRVNTQFDFANLPSQIDRRPLRPLCGPRMTRSSPMTAGR
jgi:hypothetical protein